jgi:hypothetical protein
MDASLDDIRTLQYSAVQYQFSRCLHCIAEFGVADALGDEPQTAAALAASVGAHPDILERVLRFLAAGGIFTDLGDRFGHSAQSRLLRADHPQSQLAFIRLLGGKLSWEAFGVLDYAMRTGKPALEAVVSEGLFAYMATHPEGARIFDEGMTSKTLADVAGVVRAWPFANYSSVADIGGGRGHLLRAVLQAAPRATGVLFDLPQVLDRAVAGHERLRLQAGDFFRDTVPVAALYLLMNVIHDWADAEAIAILSGIRRSVPADGRLLVIETVLGDSGAPPSQRRLRELDLDVAMLAFTGGRERTRAQYEDLLRRAGFRLHRLIDTESGLGILESVPA